MSEAEKMAEEQTKQTEVAADAQVKVAEETTKQAEIGARVAEQVSQAQVTQAEIVTAATAEPEAEAAEEIEHHEYVDVERFAECQTRISALESQLEKLSQLLTRSASPPTEAPRQASPSTPREETAPASPANRPEPPAPSEATKQEQEKPPAARRRAHRWI